MFLQQRLIIDKNYGYSNVNFRFEFSGIYRSNNIIATYTRLGIR